MAGMKNIITGPLDRFYPTAKAMYMWRMGRAHDSFDKGPVLLLQMGKVGSKSVQAGLEAIVRDRPIYHAHFLSPERTLKTERQRRKFFRTDRHTYLMRPWLNEFVLKAFQENRDDHVWKLITLTREPIGRNMSAFFENLEVEAGSAKDEYLISSDYYGIAPTRVTIDDTDKLSKLFFERAPHDSAVHFFDREIRDIFGIDVLASGFSIDRGYQIYKGGRVELLVMRLEDLSDVASRACNEFLEIGNFQLINQNIGAKKLYAPLYDAFKSSVAIDAEYADQLYKSRYMQTFYSAQEIKVARDKWLGIAAALPD
jgi:hypothetical protein